MAWPKGSICHAVHVPCLQRMFPCPELESCAVRPLALSMCKQPGPVALRNSWLPAAAWVGGAGRPCACMQRRSPCSSAQAGLQIEQRGDLALHQGLLVLCGQVHGF